MEMKFCSIIVAHDMTKKQWEECKALVNEAKGKSKNELGDWVYKVRGPPGLMKIVRLRAISHWRELFAWTIRANVRIVVLAWVFTLTRMQMFAQTGRVVCSVKCNSREQLANQANFWLIFYLLILAGWKLYLKSINTLAWTMYFPGFLHFRYAYLHKSMLVSQQFLD